jgi:hypothetical protein
VFPEDLGVTDPHSACCLRTLLDPFTVTLRAPLYRIAGLPKSELQPKRRSTVCRADILQR